MSERTTVKLNNKISHERDLRTWWRCALGAMIGILVAVGFAVAAKQHFNALEASARNVEMQRERHRLKSEQKRLILEREAAASPAQLEKMARNIGLQNLSVRQINHYNQMESHEPEIKDFALESAPKDAETKKMNAKIKNN
jgi:cell division protein FtsL